jgi:hypothetical protein
LTQVSAVASSRIHDFYVAEKLGLEIGHSFGIISFCVDDALQPHCGVEQSGSSPGS